MPMVTEQIKKDIIDTMYWDSRVDAADVTVEVDDNTVYLGGSVPSYFARRAAEYDALDAAGASRVKNDIHVRFPGDMALLSDTELVASIDQALRWSPAVDNTKIEVSADTGFVTLEGTVDSYWEKLHAEELTGSMAGVTAIENKLTVVPTDDLADQSIAASISRSLDRNPNIDIDDVNVIVADGIVTLTGRVSNWFAFRAAQKSAQYTTGVVDVINNLDIRPTQTTYAS